MNERKNNQKRRRKFLGQNSNGLRAEVCMVYLVLQYVVMMYFVMERGLITFGTGSLTMFRLELRSLVE